MNEKQVLEKLKLIEIEENKRIANNKLKFYNIGKLIHKKQMQFHKSLSKNRWAFGGNRTGKTECGAVETVWLARGIHPFKKNKKQISAWVVSLSSKCKEMLLKKSCFIT